MIRTVSKSLYVVSELRMVKAQDTDDLGDHLGVKSNESVSETGTRVVPRMIASLELFC